MSVNMGIHEISSPTRSNCPSTNANNIAVNASKLVHGSLLASILSVAVRPFASSITHAQIVVTATPSPERHPCWSAECLELSSLLVSEESLLSMEEWEACLGFLV